MLREDLLTLIEGFIKETWQYGEIDELDTDMMHIYRIEDELRKNESINDKQLYDKLLPTIGLIRLKYGFQSFIVTGNKELKAEIDRISLDDENFIEKYESVERKYKDYVENITDVDFLQLQRNYNDEGLYLAIESLKSLITHEEYREMLQEGQIEEILIDCVKMINGKGSFERIEKKYKGLVQEIWKKSLSNSIDRDSFRILFSNISGPLLEQAMNLINRPDQHSCSMISSDFVATYNGEYRRIGFMYPSDSEIIIASAYDLASNVFGMGARNKEKGTSLVTPIVLEKLGIERAEEKGEDRLSSSSYNEVCVNSKPCGIVIIGFGEKDLNVDYEDAAKLADEMGLPLYEIDMMDYKSELSEVDKTYIAYHCILSSMGIDTKVVSQLALDNRAGEIYNFVEENKETVVQEFMKLKKAGMLDKETMTQTLREKIDLPKNIGVQK